MTTKVKITNDTAHHSNKAVHVVEEWMNENGEWKMKSSKQLLPGESLEEKYVHSHLRYVVIEDDVKE